MVGQLLSAGGGMSENGSSAHNKVGPSQEQVAVNQKIFLFNAKAWFNGVNLPVKNLANAGSGLIDGLDRFK
jgi:hypothetical protein